MMGDRGFGAAAVVECFIRLGAPDRGDAGRVTAVDDLRAAGRFLTREHPHVLHLVLICAALNFLVTGFAEVGFPYMVRTVLGFLLHGVRPCIWSRGSIRTARRARRWAGREVAVHAAIPDGDRRLLAHHPAPSARHDDSRRWSDATRGAHGEHLRANLIAVPAIQMGCPENMTGILAPRAHTAGRTASTRRARSWR